MNDEMDVKMYRSATGLKSTCAVTFSDTVMYSNEIALAVIKEIVEIVAKKFVDEHYGEIISRLDQNAIANLAIAEASKKIAEEIQRRPTVQDINVKAQVYKHFSLF